MQTCFYCKKEAKKRFFFSDTIVEKCPCCSRNCCNTCFISHFNLDDPELTKLLTPQGETLLSQNLLCPSCDKTLRDIYSKADTDFYNACRSEDEVEIVSENYKGVKNTEGEQKVIKTSFYDDKNEALSVLKGKARYFGFDIIINVSVEQDKDYEETNSGGEYWFSTWSYSGIATKKKD